jgi:hypothetical protein
MLTRMPIVVYRGDDIPPSRPTSPGGTTGGSGSRWPGSGPTPLTGTPVTPPLVHLPEIGLTGNMHFLFSDLNNLQIADQISAFPAQKGLDS